MKSCFLLLFIVLVGCGSQPIKKDDISIVKGEIYTISFPSSVECRSSDDIEHYAFYGGDEFDILMFSPGPIGSYEGYTPDKTMSENVDGIMTMFTEEFLNKMDKKFGEIKFIYKKKEKVKLGIFIGYQILIKAESNKETEYIHQRVFTLYDGINYVQGQASSYSESGLDTAYAILKNVTRNVVSE